MNLDEWTSPLISSVLVVVLAALGLVIVHFLTKRARRIIRSVETIHEERRQQIDTIVHIARWAASVLIVVAALLMLLSTFVDIAPLLASAGVAGLAVSLGAQTLMKDLIGGFLILVENQYAVGDVIQAGDVTGTVERLTLRATYVRDLEGRLHVVPNGEVRVVSNLTKEWSRALVDVGVAYEEDLDRALRVLEGVAEVFAEDVDFGPQLLEPPQVLGPVSLGDWAITVRVMVKTQPGKQWGIARELQRRILAACEREDVTLPYPRQEVWVRGPDQS
jgi:small-conductance mechanosensitive channel